MDAHNDMPRLRQRRRARGGPDRQREAPRRLDHAAMAAISPLPPPEEVFLDWLMSVPHGIDIETSARRQIEIIDRRHSLHPDVQRLRLLLVAIAGEGHCRRTVFSL